MAAQASTAKPPEETPALPRLARPTAVQTGKTQDIGYPNTFLKYRSICRMPNAQLSYGATEDETLTAQGHRGSASCLCRS